MIDCTYLHVNALGLLEEGRPKRKNDRNGSIANESELKTASTVTVLFVWDNLHCLSI